MPDFLLEISTAAGYEPADLPASTAGLIRLQQARLTLSDLASRRGEFSFPLTLPATRANARLFGVDKLHPQAGGKFAATDYPFRLTCADMVLTGTFRVSSLRNGYTGMLLAAGRSWSALLGEKTLTDLNFPIIDYDGSQYEAVVAGSCNTTDVQFVLTAYGNWYAPPITRRNNRGQLETVPAPASAAFGYPLAVDDVPPGVYYRNILRRIFTDIGYTLFSAALENDYWRRVVLLPAGADLDKAWPWGSLLPAQGTGAGQSFSYYESGPASAALAWQANEGAGLGETVTSGGPVTGPSSVAFLPVPLTAQQIGGTRALDLPAARYTASRAGTYSFVYEAQLASGSQQVEVDDALAVAYDGGYGPDALYYIGLGLLASRASEGYAGGDEGRATPGAVTGGGRLYGLRRLDNHTAYAAPVPGFYSLTVPADIYLEAGDTVQLVAFALRRFDTDGNTGRFKRKQLLLNWQTAALVCGAYADADGISLTGLLPARFLPPLRQRDVLADFLTRTNSVVLADDEARTARIVSRTELSAGAGPALDLSDYCDPAAVEYGPPLGSYTGVRFVPADNDEPLPVASDVVEIGPQSSPQTVQGLYAPVALRQYVERGNPGLPRLPTCSTADILKQPASETQWDVKGQPPRLVWTAGPASSVAFQRRNVPVMVADWVGAIRWGGTAGAVARYYATLPSLVGGGHTAKVSAWLSPARYRGLVPGRRVYLFGAAYTVEGVSGWPLAAGGGLGEVSLVSEVM